MTTDLASLAALGSTALGYVAPSVIESIIDEVGGAMLKKCSDRRTHGYFLQLADSLGEDIPEPDRAVRIRAALERVAAREETRETVHEYYRRSVLSRSKEIGPRILALLAARMIREQREPTAVEHQIADVAETCTDGELSEFERYYASLEAEASDPRRDVLLSKVTVTREGFYVRLEQESSTGSVTVGPLCLSSELGPWAAKFERAGAIEQNVQSSIQEGEASWDGKGLRHETAWSLCVLKACKELARMLPLVRPQ